MTDTTNIAEGTGSSADLSAASGLTTRRSKRFYRGPLFLLTVLLPTCLSVIYFGILASDVYISDARFVVRSPAAFQAAAKNPMPLWSTSVRVTP
jgi:capsule polysaccharide export protein KpsE/RkpR